MKKGEIEGEKKLEGRRQNRRSKKGMEIWIKRWKKGERKR